MNWLLPVEDLGRRVQGPSCADGECEMSQWQRWRRRNAGVFLGDKWYCSEACLKRGMERLILRTPKLVVAHKPSAHRLPLGLLMLSRGVIDEPDLAAALAMKSKCPQQRIGECMRNLGLVNEEEVTRALGMQSCLPVLLGYEPEAEHLVPLRLQEAAEVFCFRSRYNPKLVYAGFATGVDRPVVSGVEAMLGSPVEPCIIPAHVVAEKLAVLAERHEGSELVFEARMAVPETVRSICSYARQVGTERIRIASTRHYLWARLQGQNDHDLLFRLDPTP
jgi:hypothetical protein